jgi:hypothetical protein
MLEGIVPSMLHWISIFGGLLIMMGRHARSEALFYRLEDQVPESHLLRLIDKHISFEFVREQLKNSYSETGQLGGKNIQMRQERNATQTSAAFQSSQETDGLIPAFFVRLAGQLPTPNASERETKPIVT